jgi:hypothetical protein
MIRKRQGISISSKLLQRLTKKFTRRDAYRMSLPDILDAKKDAVRRYNKLKKRADDLRVDFHKKVAKARALKYHTTIEVQEKLTRNAFRQKSLFARIK